MNRESIRRAIEGLRHETNAAERRGQAARQRQEKLLDELEETRLEIRAANKDRDAYVAARDELLDADTQTNGYAETPSAMLGTGPQGCVSCYAGPWETHAPGCRAVAEDALSRLRRDEPDMVRRAAQVERVELDLGKARSQPR